MSNIRWSKAKAGKPAQLAGVRFPRDPLGQAAKQAFATWKAGLTRQQLRKLYTAPTR